MPSVHRHFSQQFHKWEMRGRGWQFFGQPVRLEPRFVPFIPKLMTEVPAMDDGCRPSFLGSLFRKVIPPPKSEPASVEPDEEPEPMPVTRDAVVEFRTSLPADLGLAREEFEQFLSSLSLCREPIAFELLGFQNKVTAQFAAGSPDASLVHRQLQAYFPETMFSPRENVLEEAWGACSGEESLVVDFGLAREFMFSLASGKLDPFIGIIAALSEMAEGELGLFQVLWQPVHESWHECVLNSVTDEEGKPLFVNMPELTAAAEKKVSKRLYAAVVRIAAAAGTFERALEIACGLAGSLRVFAQPGGNELIPLRNDDYPLADHIEDVIRRQSRRTGMLLNGDELVGFAHLPSEAVRSPALERQSGKQAPAIVRQPKGLLLGNNDFLGESSPVRLMPDQRVYHTHIIGATGTGKSTLLFNMIRQDIENRQGVAVFDPHGDLVERILGVIPTERINDVILVDPADEDFSIGFNILSAHGDHEKRLLASDLVSLFQRLSTSWGDQMHSVLQNAILAFLDSSKGGTLADLRRFLIEPSFRHEFLKSVSDPNILYYWHKGFSLLSGNQSRGPILTRLEMFLSQRPIAHMVSQRDNRLDFADMMDSGKIFLAKLPEGLLGRENSYLLGAVLISKFQQLVMARQAKNVAARRDFWIYVDEFANFITPSMAEILSGARKYRIGLTLAHHELHQLQKSPEVASAVMTHPYARVVFRVGDEDAKKLAGGFSSFEAGDLTGLGVGQAACRVQRSDYDFNLSVPLSKLPDGAALAARRQEVIAASQKAYGTPRAQIEAMLRQAWADEAQKPEPVKVKQPPEAPAPAPPVPVQPSLPQPPPASASAAVQPDVPHVPHDTVSEKKIDEPPRDLGRGGAVHRAIQRRIQKAAEQLGFRGVIEKPVLDGEGAVDLFLERKDRTIACEISFTTTVDHEVGHVSSRLKAGIPMVAVICIDEQRLRKIEHAVVSSLGLEAAGRVQYFQPEQFIGYLKELPAPTPEPATTVSHGYNVKTKFSKSSLEEQQHRDDILHSSVSQIMKLKKK